MTAICFKAVKKSVELLQKPLRRIEIEEIGLKEDTERKAAIASVEAKQSSAKKEMEAKDRQMFEKFTVKASGDMGEAKVNGDSGVSFNTTSASCTQSEVPQVNHQEKIPTEDSKSENSAVPSALSNSQTVETVASSNQRQETGRLQNESSRSKPTSPREGGGLTSISSALEREPPQTSFQFQADFKVLKNNLQAFYTYFKVQNMSVKWYWDRSLEDY